jgi:hypothetical protein
VIKALASAGATEEILALVNSCFEQCLTPQDTGRPRQYANRNEQQRAYRERKRREKALAAPEKLVLAPEVARVPSLKGLLVDAAGWNVDRDADVAPILALIAQGCDLEADILPVVARNVPDLTRPLRSWGAQWLVQDILAARDLRLSALGVPSDAPKAPMDEEVAVTSMLRTLHLMLGAPFAGKVVR